MLAAPVELGLGASEALALTGTGRVDSVFARAVYLRLPGGLLALTTLDVPSGPIHARTAAALAAAKVGERVLVTPSLLEVGATILDLASASRWTGELPLAAELDARADLAQAVLAAAPMSSVPEPLIASALGPLGRGRVEEVAAILGGAGPGLTPAGDDCLAGILLVASVRWGAPAAGRLAAVAASVATNDVALAFLRWAARGQSIEPVHRLLTSVAAGNAAAAGAALEQLVRFGHSSGADLALGLGLGLRYLPASQSAEPRITTSVSCTTRIVLDT